MNILENLYYGNINPHERYIKQGSKVDKLVKLICKNEEDLNNSLTEKQKEIFDLEKSYGGIKDMDTLPAAIFIVDPKKERNAVLEAKKLGIPVVAIVDTNCDPDDADYVIPGNDDAIRAIKLISSVIADAVIEGRQGEQTVAETTETVAEEVAE